MAENTAAGISSKLASRIGGGTACARGGGKLLSVIKAGGRGAGSSRVAYHRHLGADRKENEMAVASMWRVVEHAYVAISRHRMFCGVEE